MSAWIYRKPEATHERGLCVICKKNKQKRTSKGTFTSICNSCERKRWKHKPQAHIKPRYGKYKKEQCERCGFIAEHRCQLDIHHIDKNHHNNDPNNLQTLCANCHRFIHVKNKPVGKLIPTGFLVWRIYFFRK